MGDTTDIKKGVAINHNNDIYVVTDFQFTNPGKGAAFTKVKMKSVATGKSIEITYKSGESVNTVYVNKQTMQYLYESNSLYSFMNKETYETIEANASVIGEDSKYLKEGLDVIAVVYEGNIIAIELPKKVQYKVVQAEPAVKGDTASGNVTKDVTLDNGMHVQVPIFIKEGEEVTVNTETGDYGGRVS